VYAYGSMTQPDSSDIVGKIKANLK
jgi:hypothetical protein